MKKYLLYIGILLFILPSCKVTKKILHAKKGSKKENLSLFFGKVDSAALNYQTIKLRFSGKIKTKESSLNTSGQIRMIKDSLIWANATALLGIEVGRVLITKDSVFLQNNIKHTIEIWSIDSFSQQLGIETGISSLQSLFLGEFVHFSMDSFSVKEKVFRQDSLYNYQAFYLLNDKSYDYKASLNKYLRTDSVHITQMPQRNFIDLKYSNYIQKENFVLPTNLNFLLTKASSKEQQFGINYKKLYFDKSFSIPALSFDKYKIIRH